MPENKRHPVLFFFFVLVRKSRIGDERYQILISVSIDVFIFGSCQGGFTVKRNSVKDWKVLINFPFGKSCWVYVTVDTSCLLFYYPNVLSYMFWFVWIAQDSIKEAQKLDSDQCNYIVSLAEALCHLFKKLGEFCSWVQFKGLTIKFRFITLVLPLSIISELHVYLIFSFLASYYYYSNWVF